MLLVLLIRQIDYFCLDLQLVWGSKLDLKIAANAGRLQLPVQMADLELMGTLRIMLGPFINRPSFFKAVSISFLTTPSINFKLNAFLLPISRIPGLSGFLNDTVEYGFQAMTWPHAIPINMTDGELSHRDVAALMYREAIGTVRIRIRRADNLRNVDIVGKSDPYCTISIGRQQHRTTVIQNSLNPSWDEAFELLVFAYQTETIRIKVMDKDGTSQYGQSLGEVEIDVDSLRENEFVENRQYSLHDSKAADQTSQKVGVVVQPEIHLDIEWKPFIATPSPYTDVPMKLSSHWDREVKSYDKALFQDSVLAQMKPQRISNTKLFITVKALWNIDEDMLKKKLQVVLKVGPDRLPQSAMDKKSLNSHKTQSYPSSAIWEGDHGRTGKFTKCMIIEEGFCFDIDTMDDSLHMWIHGFGRDVVQINTPLTKFKNKGSTTQLKYYQFNFRTAENEDALVDLEITWSLKHVEYPDAKATSKLPCPPPLFTGSHLSLKMCCFNCF